MNSKEQEIIITLNKIRPYLNRDGGDIEFVKYENQVVYVRMLGACSDCLSLFDTLKMGVEAILVEEVEGVKEVALSD